MTLSGEERGGNYVLKVALKDFSNYEWEDGGNGELSFVLSVKNQPVIHLYFKLNLRSKGR